MKIFNIFIILLFLFPIQKDPRYNKQGKPSIYGIEQYIKNNSESLIKEYEYRIDTLYDVYIFTENLQEDEGSDDLGEFYIPDYIIITNQEKFVGYEFKDLSKFRQKTLPSNERTVKAVVFHELTHAYFYQTLLLMDRQNKSVSSEYGNIRFFPNAELRFGSEFIEEGVCEYVVYYLHEDTAPQDVVIPDNEEELTNGDNKVNIIYQYSLYVLKDFLDKEGIKKGIEILIGNKPPTYHEILNPKIYFNRIMPDAR